MLGQEAAQQALAAVVAERVEVLEQGAQLLDLKAGQVHDCLNMNMQRQQKETYVWLGRIGAQSDQGNRKRPTPGSAG